MKKEEQLKDNLMNMKSEYQVSHHKICRKIDSIFVDELKHFNDLIHAFNDEYKCMEMDQINLVLVELKNVFNSCKVILVGDYESRFEKNVESLTSTMYDFFYRKLSNPKTKCPVRLMNKYLIDMCKFDCFLIEDKLENDLIDFSDNFIYKYVNSEDEQVAFVHLVKNVNYSLMCELKKAIALSIEDKQDITMRYNSLNKALIGPNNARR